eukprot:gene6362-biopygen23869
MHSTQTWRSLGGTGGPIADSALARVLGQGHPGAKSRHLGAKKMASRPVGTPSEPDMAPGWHPRKAGRGHLGAKRHQLDVTKRRSDPLAPYQGRIWHPGGTQEVDCFEIVVDVGPHRTPASRALGSPFSPSARFRLRMQGTIPGP